MIDQAPTPEHPAVAFERRAADARDARTKHVNAADNWAHLASSEKDKEKALLYLTLSSWMVRYADVDAEAEKLFRELATKVREASRCGHGTPACEACVEYDTIAANST